MLDSPHIHLRLAGEPENVTVVRELLAGVAGPLEIPAGLLENIRTAVSEACNNVVMHAYERPPGPMQLDLCVQDSELEIVVRDEGTGIRPHPGSREEGLDGIGLSLIQAFSDRVQLSGAPGEGTEVRMWFGLPRAPPRLDTPPGQRATPPAPRAAPACEELGESAHATLAVAPGALAHGVLGRLAPAIGARAGLPVDRLSDVQLVVDALAAHAPPLLAGPRLQAAFAAEAKRLDLSVGPFVPGGSQALLESTAIGGLGSVLAGRAPSPLRDPEHAPWRRPRRPFELV